MPFAGLELCYGFVTTTYTSVFRVIVRALPGYIPTEGSSARDIPVPQPLLALPTQIFDLGAFFKLFELGLAIANPEGNNNRRERATFR